MDRRKLRELLDAQQKGHCALCPAKHPLDIHHIVPQRDGGLDTPENCILLCKNHHDLADSGALTPEMLVHYRRIAYTSEVHLPVDPAVIYEMTIDSLSSEVRQTNRSDCVRLAESMLSRLKRATGIRYATMALKLIETIIYANRHCKTVNIARVRKLRQLAGVIASELGGNQKCNLKTVEGFLGVALHNSGDYKNAIQLFNESISAQHLDSSSPVQKEEHLLTLVSLPVSTFLNGQHENAIDSLRDVQAEVFELRHLYPNASCFASVKCAEQLINEEKFTEAEQTLELEDKPIQGAPDLLPVYRVIMYKVLARTKLYQGREAEGLGLLIQAASLAEGHHFYDQLAKIEQVFTDFGWRMLDYVRIRSI